MQSITIQLPEKVYRQLSETTRSTGASLDDVALRSIRAGFPPDLEQTPARFRADLRQLDQMSSELLHTLTTADLDLQKAALYEELLDKNQREELTAGEQQTLDNLREEADLLMFRRAYAAALLKWRRSRFTDSL
jgi:hypothetical protein